MNWVQLLSTIVLAGAAVGVVIKVIVVISRGMGKLAQFLDDWFGEPERPGVAPARPGVMSRLQSLERSVKTVEHEVKPNGGASMADKVDRIQAHTVPLEARAEPPATPAPSA